MNTVSVQELKDRLDEGEKINLLDVREDHERSTFNIGGKHIPIGQIQLFELDDIESWKDQEIIVYCKSGNRSAMATMMLQQAGFENPVNLTGGMLAWVDKFGGSL